MASVILRGFYLSDALQPFFRSGYYRSSIFFPRQQDKEIHRKKRYSHEQNTNTLSDTVDQRARERESYAAVHVPQMTPTSVTMVARSLDPGRLANMTISESLK